MEADAGKIRAGYDEPGDQHGPEVGILRGADQHVARGPARCPIRPLRTRCENRGQADELPSLEYVGSAHLKRERTPGIPPGPDPIQVNGLDVGSGEERIRLRWGERG